MRKLILLVLLAFCVPTIVMAETTTESSAIKQYMSNCVVKQLNEKHQDLLLAMAHREAGAQEKLESAATGLYQQCYDTVTQKMKQITQAQELVIAAAGSLAVAQSSLDKVKEENQELINALEEDRKKGL